MVDTALTRLDRVPKRAPAEAEANRLAVRAVYRGHASPGQQVMAMRWILEDVLGLTAAPSASASEYQAGFAAGKQWSGMTIASFADLRLWTPQQETDHDT